MDVLRSCETVVAEASHVTIDDGAAAELASRFPPHLAAPAAFDGDLHFVDAADPELTARALLAVDALNFCFWPCPSLEYEHLSRGVRAAVLADRTCVDAARLAAASAEDVARLFGGRHAVPAAEERARLLREVGTGLLSAHGGSAAALIASAGGSAVALAARVAALFPGFRDHAIYRGRQVFFYKRAQIFVADVYGAFGGVGLGAFADIGALTMFADYRVPGESTCGARSPVRSRGCRSAAAANGRRRRASPPQKQNNKRSGSPRGGRAGLLAVARGRRRRAARASGGQRAGDRDSRGDGRGGGAHAASTREHFGWRWPSAGGGSTRLVALECWRARAGRADEQPPPHAHDLLLVLRQHCRSGSRAKSIAAIKARVTF